MTSLWMYLEYDNAPQTSDNYCPFSGNIQVIDYTKIDRLVVGKPYELIALLSHSRAHAQIHYSHGPRGLPENVGYYSTETFSGKNETCGWIDIDDFKNLMHLNQVDLDFFPLDFRMIFHTMEFLSEALGKEKVRLIYFVT